MNNQCYHDDVIGKAFYDVIVDENIKYGNKQWKPWNELDAPQREAFRVLARKALPIIGKHALDDVKDYLGVQMAAESGWKRVMYWLAAAVIGGVATFCLSGCGHDVVMTPDGTTVSKDGSTLIVQPGFLSFTQSAPEPTTLVIIQKGK